MQTLVDALRERAQKQPDWPVITFLRPGENPAVLSYGALDRRACLIAGHLQQRAAAGSRASLLFPAGPAFIEAFWGCLYAGMLAVPAPSLRHRRRTPRTLALFRDYEPACVLTDSGEWENVALALQEWGGPVPPCIATDTLGEGPAWEELHLRSDSLAFLQYTSGSTSVPKGTMVSHGNLLQNIELLRGAFDVTQETRQVSWLPHFHDMGLIASILMPVVTGSRVYLMAPESFVQRPLRWLEALSEYGGDLSFAPNFAYELCREKILPEQRGGLDLSAWTTAVNAAETIRPATLSAFAEYFAPCGFQAAAFTAGYGLAENTLVATASPLHEEVRIHEVDPAALQDHRIEPAKPGGPVRALVDCGLPCPTAEVAIVDPDTGERLGEDRVGEVWLAGPSVAQGYWRNAEATAERFGAHIHGEDNKGPFFRTGDLGFLHEGSLTITGRTKEIIIIRGFNHYPQDIEATALEAHPALTGGSGAAFAVEGETGEQLVLVHEVGRRHVRSLDAAAVADAVRIAVSEVHALDVDTLVLMKPGGVPRTSSGKIQRARARADFLAGALEVLAVSELARPLSGSGAQPPDVAAAEGGQAAAIVRFIRDWLADRLGIPHESIDVQRPFSSLGLNSLSAVQLAGELEDFLGRRVTPTLAYEYPSVALLSAHLAGKDQPGPEFARNHEPGEPVAIVGMACRFPGAENVDAFWELLAEGRDAITETPPDRWDVDAYYAPTPGTPGKVCTRWGGWLSGIFDFDAAFFGISPREAAVMDPQQRLLLETAWHAFEDACIDPSRLAGSHTGVFAGVGPIDSMVLQVLTSAFDAYMATGNTQSVAANRLSYFFDLMGPSIALDTACSASLIAVHKACRSLRSRECDAALAGGVNAMLAPGSTITLSQARMLAPDGRCKAFDARANGYVRSEGCGVVVLKRLEDALRDGDRVRAVIRGSAVNHGGRSNGLTAPNSRAQQQVLREAMRDAGVSPESIGYLEAHGTGTAVGDPIEFETLKRVLLDERNSGPAVLVGAVKTNVGHLEVAAGMAGLIKTVLALEHEAVPANLHFETPNPLLAIEGAPVRFPVELEPWRRGERERLAGVSAFGFGGANAHVVVGETPETGPKPAVERPWHVLGLSAHTEPALRKLAGQYAEWLRKHTEHDLAAVCHTANTGRCALPERLAVPVGDVDADRQSVAETLAGFAAGEGSTAALRGRAPRPAKLAMLFTGQGAQYPGMGRALYDTERVFREAMDECAAVLDPLLEQAILPIIFGGPEAELLHQTAYTQPAMFALETSLARLWASWGVRPDVVMGHSIGENAAACVAGAMSLADGCKLVAARGRLIQSAPQHGAMAAVFADRAATEAALRPFEDKADVAAANGPELHVISGDEDAVEGAVSALAEQGIRTSRLKVSHAFHSPHMDSILDAFEKAISGLEFRPLTMPLASTMTGEIVPAGTTLGARYWRDQIRAAVNFKGGMRRLAELECTVFLEAGPDATLTGMGRRCIEAERYGWANSLNRKRGDIESIATALATVQAHGVEIDWRDFDGGRRRLAPLPLYPFERIRHWNAPAWGCGLLDGQAAAAPLQRDDLGGLFYRVAWQAVEPAGLLPASRWVLLGGGNPLQQNLAGAIEALDHEAVCSGAEAADSVAEWAVKDGAPVHFVSLHGWGVVQPGAEGATQACCACGAVVKLVQALCKTGVEARLTIVTRAARCVGADNATANPNQSALWGLGQTLQLEHPELGVRLVDVAQGMDDWRPLAEALLSADGEDQAAVAADGRFAARIAHLDPAADGAFSCDPGASYLVTGGLGGLGVETARWLVGRGARRLLLLSRRALPPRKDWETAEGPMAARIRVVRELESAGAAVVVGAADAADGKALRQTIEAFEAVHPRIKGVFHLAGLIEDQLVQTMDLASFARLFAPKAVGAWNLCEVFTGRELDAFVLFSSAASLTGSVGQGNYAAANGILDGLAAWARTRGLPVLSINWGPWAEVGMAAAQALEGQFASQGVTPIPPEKGLAALQALLSSSGGPPQVGVLDADWPRMLQAAGGRAAPFFANVAEAPARSSQEAGLASALRAAKAPERPGLLRDALRSFAAKSLGVSAEDVPTGKSAAELGMDSIMVSDMVRILSEELGMPVHPREVFGADSLDELSGTLAHAFAPEPNDAAEKEVRISTESLFDLAALREAVPMPKLPACAFVLSAPRSGSTLLRAMLSAHPGVFAPPELHLLPFATMAARRAFFGADRHLDEGLLTALMELRGIPLEAAMEAVKDLEERAVPSQEVLGMLQAEAEPRFFAEKAPINAFELTILERSAALCECPKYVFVHRHPYAVIDSAVRTRMPWVFDGVEGEPYAVAEAVWTLFNRNICDFIRPLPDAQCMTIAFEDLVREPEKAVCGLCAFLDLPYEPAMLRPYENGRMLHGPIKGDPALGDPNFLKRWGIDAALADAWRRVELPEPLGKPARLLAEELGYETPETAAVRSDSGGKETRLRNETL